jgi:hypothetical protein
MSFLELSVNILHNIKHTMASETTELELTSRTPHSSTADIQPQHSGTIDSVEANNNTETNAEFFLPPTDGGKDAWLFLLSCFMLEALIWGMRFLDAKTYEHQLKFLQAFLQPMVSFKSTTALMNLSSGPATLL